MTQKSLPHLQLGEPVVVSSEDLEADRTEERRRLALKTVGQGRKAWRIVSVKTVEGEQRRCYGGQKQWTPVLSEEICPTPTLLFSNLHDDSLGSLNRMRLNLIGEWPRAVGRVRDVIAQQLLRHVQMTGSNRFAVVAHDAGALGDSGGVKLAAERLRPIREEHLVRRAELCAISIAPPEQDLDERNRILQLLEEAESIERDLDLYEALYLFNQRSWESVEAWAVSAGCRATQSAQRRLRLLHLREGTASLGLPRQRIALTPVENGTGARARNRLAWMILRNLVSGERED